MYRIEELGILFGFKQKQNRKILFEIGVYSICKHIFILRAMALLYKIVGEENSAELIVGRMWLP